MLARVKFLTGLLFVVAIGLAYPLDAEIVLITNQGTNEVLRYDVSGTSWIADGVFCGGTENYAGSPLVGPYGVTRDDAGNVYVSEAASGVDNGRILRFTINGEFSGVVATSQAVPEYTEGTINGRPYNLHMGPDGSLFVSSTSFGDGSGNQVYKISNPASTSPTVSTFIAHDAATNGSGMDLNNPRGFDFGPDGNLYLADRNNMRVVVFDGTTPNTYVKTLMNNTHSGVNYTDVSFNGNDLIVLDPGAGVYSHDITTDVTTTLYTSTTYTSWAGIGYIGGEVCGPYYINPGDMRYIKAPTGSLGYLVTDELNNPAQAFVLAMEPSEFYIAGDADFNGIVNAEDAALLAANWLLENTEERRMKWSDGDFNLDGAVNDIDATMMAANWQATGGLSNAVVPEPSCFAILFGMGLVLLRLKGRHK